MPRREGEQRAIEALAQNPAVGLREQRLGKLVAAAGGVVEARAERLFPGFHARLDVPDVRGDEIRADREEHHPDERKGEAPGRDVQQREKGSVEHQRRPELAGDQQRRHRQPPDRQQRPELLHRRQRHAEHAAACGDKDLAVVAQVAGEEDHDCDLRELGRLEGHAAEVDREVRAVDFAPDPRQARQERRDDADQGNRVPVALEHAYAPLSQRDHRRREEHQSEDHPLRLLARQHRIDPVDHHDADARQHRRERQDVRVGVGERHAQHDVRQQAQSEEQRPVRQRRARGSRQDGIGVRRQAVVLLLDEDRREPGRDQQGRRNQAEQLTVARAEHA